MTKLKVKSLKLSAGRPIAILNKKYAKNFAIHPDNRVYVSKGNKKIVAVVDTANGLLKNDELIVSEEVIKYLKIKDNEKVEVRLAPKPQSIIPIKKKLDGKRLSKEELVLIMQEIVKNKLTDAETAFFVSGIYRNGMTMKETKDMIEAIVETGGKLGLKGKVVDKHSIGGIPGRTTPIIVSICSAAGLLMPKTSSRAITSPAGTADAMETICEVGLSSKEMKKVLKKTNACLVWGGFLNLAPADDEIIQVEKMLNLDPKEQLLASIMSKKLSVNAKYILIDIPYGESGKVTKKEAIVLRREFNELAKYFNVKLKCYLEKIDEPTGKGFGPGLEIQEVIKVLKKQDPCHNLEKRSLEISGKILEIAGKVKKGEGYNKAKEILDSGKAFKKFKDIVKAQKGNLNRANKKAKFEYEFKTEKNGKIKKVKINELNNLARTAGCPLNKFSGIYLHKHLGEKVKKGEKLLTIYSETPEELKDAKEYYKRKNPIIY